MTVTDTANKFRLHGCRLSIKEIETEMLRSKTPVMPAITMLTRSEYNFICDYLQDAKAELQKELKSIPEKI